MPVNAWRVCWNWSLTASLEGKRSNEHSNKDLMKKYYARLSISIESNQARKVNYPNVMPVRTSKVQVGRQLHPLKSMILNLTKKSIELSLCVTPLLEKVPFVRPRLFQYLSLCPSVRPSISMSALLSIDKKGCFLITP